MFENKYVDFLNEVYTYVLIPENYTHHICFSTNNFQVLVSYLSAHFWYYIWKTKLTSIEILDLKLKLIPDLESKDLGPHLALLLQVHTLLALT